MVQVSLMECRYPDLAPLASAQNSNVAQTLSRIHQQTPPLGSLQSSRSLEDRALKTSQEGP